MVTFQQTPSERCRSGFASGLNFDISLAEDRVVRVTNIKKSASSTQKAQ